MSPFTPRRCIIADIVVAEHGQYEPGVCCSVSAGAEGNGPFVPLQPELLVEIAKLVHGLEGAVRVEVVRPFEVPRGRDSALHPLEVGAGIDDRAAR